MTAPLDVDGDPAVRAAAIRAILDAAPPLSAETRRRLRPICAGGLPPASEDPQAA